MPAPIIKAMVDFLQQQLNANVWEGEVPRFDTQNNPIFPNVVDSPSNWPVIRIYQQEGMRFKRTWTTEDAYDDRGPLMLQIHGVKREETEPLMDSIEAAIASVTNWKTVISPDLGGNPMNPFYIIQMLLDDWGSYQEEGVRLAGGQLSYRCDMTYDCHIHGAVATS